MIKKLILIIALFVIGCSEVKLPPIPIRDSRWCETEKCDKILFIISVAIGPDGRAVNIPYIDKWRIPKARCKEEIDFERKFPSGPISNLPGYSRTIDAWCE